jgi:hypothetical protein
MPIPPIRRESWGPLVSIPLGPHFLRTFRARERSPYFSLTGSDGKSA